MRKKIDALLMRLKFDPWFDYSETYEQNLGLVSIATYCKKKNLNVLVLNEPHITFELLNNILKVERIGVLGFYCDADNIHMTLSMINLLKDKHPKLICVTGGPQVSAIPWDKKIVTESKCDFAVRGEGEKPFSNIVYFVNFGKPRVDEISGTSYISNGKFRRNPDSSLLDPREMPVPDRTLTYFPSIPTGTEIIYTAKGCPYHCAFCSEGAIGQMYRMRDTADVVSEVENLLKTRNLRYMLIMDDIFTLNANRVLELVTKFKELQQKYHQFYWYCEGRANIIRENPGIIKPMIDSGLIRLQIGIESGSQGILDKYGKALTLDDIRETVKLCYDEGLTSLVGNFIVGGPFETLDTLGESVKFAKELLELAPGCLDLNVAIYSPYPSTEMYLKPEQFGIEMLDRECITGSTMQYVFTRTKELTKWDLLRAKDDFTQEIESKALLLVQFIPHERITRHFGAFYNIGMNSMWHRAISKISRYNNYFSSIVCEEKKTLNDVADNINLYKPLRTLPIKEALNDEIILTVEGDRKIGFSQLSSRIFELCSGKLTTSQIVSILYDENKGKIDQIVLEKYMLNFFGMLDREKLVVFSEI